MSTRKKPQQQLASYFDELLTELDAPCASTSTAEQPADTQVITQQRQSAPLTPPSASAAVVTAGTASLQPQPSTIKASAHVSRATTVIEKEDKLAAVQQAKLQRLLHSLLPDVDNILPDEQKALEERFLTQDKGGKTEVIESPAYSPQVAHEWDSVTEEWQDNGRPSWAQGTFDILLVSVQGINLALPLATLDAIYPIGDTLTPLFGQADWFMGLQRTLKGNNKVIDTALYFMPERYKKGCQDQLNYSVAINGSGWSLAVDDIHQPQVTYPEDIRWRVNRTKRPWVAGTVTEHMCILLDIPMLVKLLNEKK